MAKLASPPINWGGNPPNAETQIVTQTANGQSTPPGSPPVYSRNPLTVADQLRNEPGVGYPF